ncbi:MAG: trypsin-like peptidase domain-containing protein [Planctomycetes bacterium]|nr:trypsin-like peptidase domain-containing protein [Planctomycetota bacterium]
MARKSAAKLVAIISMGTLVSAAPPLELLRSEQQMFQSVIRKASPFVVRIDTVGGAQPSAAPGQPRDDDENTPGRERDPGSPAPRPMRDPIGSRFPVADGPTTGIIYGTDGLILTSSFNFVRRPALVTVTLADGRQFVADVVGRDQVRKLALLKINATDLPVPEWAASEDVRVGQWAIALGYGYGGAEPGVSVGLISARDRMRGYALQTDAKLSPANYGGPLLDRDGRVLGICVPMAQRPGELAGIEFYDSGVGFALPHWRLAPIVEELETGRSFYRGWLGIRFAPPRGALVIDGLAEGSPLHAAGVQPGDNLLEINGESVSHIGHVQRALYLLPAGAEVDLHLRRAEKDFDVRTALIRSDELGRWPPRSDEEYDPSLPLGEEGDQP